MLPSLLCMCACVYWRICALPTVNSNSDRYQQWYKVDSCDILHVCISDMYGIICVMEATYIFYISQSRKMGS